MASGRITLNDIPEAEDIISISGYPLRYMYMYIEREQHVFILKLSHECEMDGYKIITLTYSSLFRFRCRFRPEHNPSPLYTAIPSHPICSSKYTSHPPPP